MKIILLGAPGAGKGTQAENISGQYSIPTISTGNMIRAAIHNGTELGKQAESLINAGKLVPDEIVIGMIRERLAEADCAKGFILDGFPRTIPQAEALDSMNIGIDCALSIEVADEKIMQRLSGRRVCLTCGATYHVDYKKPAKEGICNNCGAELVQRNDDKPETIADRLAVYHSQTEPLKDYYKKAGKLITVEGQEEVKDTTRLVLAALEF
jgi:adenylate kinase